jgi:ANTAR domain/GAF domain
VIDWFAEVASLIEREPSTEGAVAVGDMRRLCEAARRALRATGAGVTVMINDRTRGVVAASDAETERLEELQFTTGEGPCIDAFATRRAVLVPELADSAISRWPAYASAIYASGVRAVFAFPLQVGASRLGMMDVFRATVGGLSATELTLAYTFAEVALSTLLDAQRTQPLGEADGRAGVLGSGAELFQAQGMVMVQLGVSLTEALVRLRAYAYAENRSLHDVAADIVARRLVLDPDQP